MGMLKYALSAGVFIFAVGCGGAKPPPPVAPPTVSTAPTGPTRTDFNQIAKALVRRCVAGGWINQWRSTNEDVDAARPKIFMKAFENKTGKELDPTYLNAVLEQRMRTSGVFDMVTESGEPDFIGHGKLLRLAERGSGGARFSVYSAILELKDPTTEKMAYSCETSVKGEM